MMRCLPRPTVVAPWLYLPRLLRRQAPSSRVTRVSPIRRRFPGEDAPGPRMAVWVAGLLSTWGIARRRAMRIWSQLLPSPPSPSSQCPCVPRGFSAARSCAEGKLRQEKRGWRRLFVFYRSAGPILPGCANIPSTVPLAARKSARPLRPCEDGSGCDGSRGKPCSISLSIRNRPRLAADASLSFAGPLVAALGLLGLTRHDRNLSRKQCDRANSSSSV